jgi:hypothetical protein
MQRIDTPTKAVDLFGPGKHGFRDGDPLLAILATKLNAGWFNRVQEAIVRVIEWAGIVLNGAVYTQLLEAIQIGVGHDIGFQAGFGSNGAGEDLAVQIYGSVSLARPITITGEVGYMVTAPTGAAAIWDIEKNGVSVYTTKPQFAAASNTITPGILDATKVDCSAGDRLTFRATQVGSTIKGQKATFTVKAKLR